MISLLLTQSVFALQITFEGLPQDYALYRWDNASGPQPMDQLSERFTRYTITIPDEYIVRNDSGVIDILQSLNLWRKETPRGFGYPFTPGGRPPRYPFLPDDGSLELNRRGLYYISIGHILSRVENISNLRFSAHNGERVAVMQSGFRQELQGFKEGKPIDCTKSKGLGRLDPTWTEAQCYMCSCVNEAGVKNNRGKIAVNQVMLRRVVHKHFPNSICGVVMFKKYNRRRKKVEAAFSWAFGRSYMTFKGLPHSSYNAYERKEFKRQLNACVDTGIQAVELGPGKFDHYYNPAEASPRWANGGTRIGAHIFSRKHKLNNSNQAYLDSLASGGGRTIERPIPGFYKEPEEEEATIEK